jgi:pSer/pThr/pTyr-binding forkhead associated (FHA) protein
MPKLLVTLPEGAGETSHELTEPTVILGRVGDNDVRLEDPSVSSQHAKLTLGSSGNYVLKDLNSTNGTRVNGAHVTEVKLRPGDRLRFGKVEAVYHSDIVEHDEAVQPPPVVAEIAAQPAAHSARPADFRNASPFAKRAREKDAAGRAILVFAAVALLLFLAALAFVLTLQPPGAQT